MSIPSGLSLGQIFSRTMELYRPAFGALFVGIMLPLGIIQGLLAAALAVFQIAMARGPATAGMIAGGVTVAISVFIAVIIGVIGAGALAHASYELAAGRSVVAAESWRQGLRFRVWGTMILSGLGVVVGLVCCLVPGIYAGIVWALILPVLFEESLSFTSAMGRSNELTTFNPQGGLGNDPRLRIFLIGLATFVSTYILVTIVQMPLTILSVAVVVRSTSAGTAPGEMPAFLHWLQVPTSIGVSLIQSAFVVFSAIAMAVLYFDIRGRLEAKDIDSAIDAMGAPPRA